jgi:hypothetical protein
MSKAPEVSCFRAISREQIVQKSEGWAYITISRSIIGDAAHFDAEWSVHPASNSRPWRHNDATPDHGSAHDHGAACSNASSANDAPRADHRVCIHRAQGDEASRQQYRDHQMFHDCSPWLHVVRLVVLNFGARSLRPPRQWPASSQARFVGRESSPPAGARPHSASRHPPRSRLRGRIWRAAR